MAERIIHQADLRDIENKLRSIHEGLRTIDARVDTTNENLQIVYDEIGSLAQEFHEFVNLQQKANRLGQAETRLVKIRQEIENKYGHYDIVRRTTTGILQADDLGIVKKRNNQHCNRRTNDINSRLLACSMLGCISGMDK